MRTEYVFTPTIDDQQSLQSLQGEDIVHLRAVLADGTAVEIVEGLAGMLRAAVHEAASGRALTLVPSDEEVSPAKAGQLLGLSRQYVDRLIANGTLPARRLPGSTHRKLRVADVMAFAEQRDERRARITQMVDTLVDAGADY